MAAAAICVDFSMDPNLKLASLGRIVLVLGLKLGLFPANLDRTLNIGLEFGTFKWLMHWISTKFTPSSSSQWNGCKSEKHWQSEPCSATK